MPIEVTTEKRFEEDIAAFFLFLKTDCGIQ